MGMAFPLFVLMACESDPRAQYQKGTPGAGPLSRPVGVVCMVMQVVRMHEVMFLCLSYHLVD